MNDRGPDAWLLAASDDVATAVRALAAGSRVEARRGDVVREVTLAEAIPAGHKFALRPLAAGLRIRKYGEYIGRTTTAIEAGAWIHEHNLATSARRSPDLERAWIDARPAHAMRALGRARCAFGKSPVWSEREGRLYFIDSHDTPAIHALDPASGDETRWPMPEEIGCIVPSSDAMLIACLRFGFAAFDPARGALDRFPDAEPARPGSRLNDGKCDARGRLWCGAANPDSGLAEGGLFALEGRAHCRRVPGDWLAPDGITWSPDGVTMYVADTRRGAIDAFAFDRDEGTLRERRVFADLAALPGGPVGACVDRDGFLWSTVFDGACLLRLDPAGRIDRVLRLPVSKPASCAFGGPDYRTLFVTTASRGLSASRFAAEPMAGHVLALDVGVAGLAPDAFVPRGG